MKSLKNYIQEKLIIKKNKYKYFPKTKQELKAIIKKRIEKEGNVVDLNDIDVSKITDMSDLFVGTDFNGDISNWNTSNVTNMLRMFYNCRSFNQYKYISSWNVSSVENMFCMFNLCISFNQDISRWDISNVANVSCMFKSCEKFNCDISGWDVSNVKDMKGMFYECELFNQDISSWDVLKVKNFKDIFLNCTIEEKHKPKFK